MYVCQENSFENENGELRVFVNGFPKIFVHETGRAENEHYVTYKRRHPYNGSETALRTCRVGSGQQQKVVDSG